MSREAGHVARIENISSVFETLTGELIKQTSRKA